MAQSTKPTFRLADYDGGLRSHPTPEPKGSLVLSSDGKWELHYAGGFGKKDRWINIGIVRYPFDVTSTGASSCHVAISDLMDPSLSAGFDLPDTPAARLKEALAAWTRSSTVVLAQHVANYDGGFAAHPKPQPLGMLRLMRDGKWQLDFIAGGNLTGGVERYPFDVKVTSSSSCHVTMIDVNDSTISASFDLPHTSAAALQEGITAATRQAAAAREKLEQIQQLTAARDAAVAHRDQLIAQEHAATDSAVAWWAGVAPQVLLPGCHYGGAKNAKELGALVATAAGIEYNGATKVSCAWSDIANLEIIETRTHRGRKRSAIGIGPLGLAVVGATALQNQRAGQVVVRRVVKLTTKQGQHGTFAPVDMSAQQFAPIQAVIGRLRTAQAAQAAAAHATPPLSVADELKKLVELKDSGVLTDEEFAQQKAKLLGS